MLTRLTDDDRLLDGIFELDNATNDRLWAESGRALGIDQRELVFGIPSYRVINAAFSHPRPGGTRFSSSDRGVWYAGFELETSQAEVGYHRRHWLLETRWEEDEVAEYSDFLADFRATFHDIRKGAKYFEYLSPDSYSVSQQLGAALLEAGSAGVVYPSVRLRGGTCIGCFRPVLVTNVRRGKIYRCEFRPGDGSIRWDKET
ncbi:MAG TPA: RES family NAD+ phosphorylase [Terriglobales bacterium]|nr:RES family NAD+ phosphorylase [Terriglobales bacterium]